MSKGIEQQNFNSLGNELLSAISVCEERIRVSRSNEIKFKEVTKRRDSAKQLCDMTKDTANHMNRIYKNVKFFLENKKSSSKSILEASIRSVSSIVKDSNLSQCVIKHENNKTVILNEKGQNINSREGGAARASMHFILKYTCIKAQPNKIQLMLLDEAFATLSTSSSLNISSVIKNFSENIGIVGIEQKDVVYAGITDRRYKAVIQNGITCIEEEVL